MSRRFSLRTLLVATTICGGLLMAWRVKVEPYRQQQAAIAMVVQRYGSMTSVPQQKPVWHKWLVETMLGDGAFVQVTELELSDVTLNEGDDLLLSGLPWAEKINLSRTPISEEGVRALGTLRLLRTLDLSHSGVTDAGLVALSGVPMLEELWLTGCDLTDRSAEALASFGALRLLMIRWTGLSPAAVAGVAAELPDCKVVYQPGG